MAGHMVAGLAAPALSEAYVRHVQTYPTLSGLTNPASNDSRLFMWLPIQFLIVCYRKIVQLKKPFILSTYYYSNISFNLITIGYLSTTIIIINVHFNSKVSESNGSAF